MSEFNSGFV